MAKKTTKFWAVNPGNPNNKKLLATFVVKDGKVTDSQMESTSVEKRAKEGFYIKGEHVTLKSDAVQFVELLEANYSMSSFVEVDIDES